MRGTLRLNEPMAAHVSWRAGGVAERCYIPADLADLAQFLHRLATDEPVYFVGLGSNLLVRDGGLRGTVILLHGALNQIKRHAGDGLIYAEAGVSQPQGGALRRAATTWKAPSSSPASPARWAAPWP